MFKLLTKTIQEMEIRNIEHDFLFSIEITIWYNKQWESKGLVLFFYKNYILLVQKRDIKMPFDSYHFTIQNIVEEYKC